MCQLFLLGGLNKVAANVPAVFQLRGLNKVAANVPAVFAARAE